MASPAPHLPRTLYTRDPSTNPLIPLPPSPVFDLPMMHSNPGLHLRTMKKRSIATRNFGLGNEGGLEPLGGKGLGNHSPAMDVPESPTVAASPTMQNSPVVTSSPAPAQHPDMTMQDHPLLASSIALSVLLGLLLLGAASWGGYRYRRRRQLAREMALSDDQDHSDKLGSHESFAASNVVEKGLRPRKSSFSSGEAFHQHSIMKGQDQTDYHYDDQEDNRRVSFMDVALSTDSIINLHDQIYGVGDSNSPLTRSRMRSNTLSAIEQSLTSSRPVSTLTNFSMVTDLEPIEEETLSMTSSQSTQSLPTIFQQPDQPTRTMAETRTRPDSIASTSSSDRTSCYTTASARSSVSDLTTLSTISCISAFPETPRSNNSPVEMDIGIIGGRDSPSAWSVARQGKAKSQTVINVKQIDLLRTAVGRTMSFQPSKQVVSALQRIEDLRTLDTLIINRDRLTFDIPAQMEAVKATFDEKASHQNDVDEVIQVFMEEEPGEADLADVTIEEVDLEAMEEVEREIAADEADISEEEEDTLVDEEHESDIGIPRPENGMKKVLFALDCPTSPIYQQAATESPTGSPVIRSRSFPSKLLSRRKASMDADPVVRRSEVISSGYLKRALRAIRGEDDTPMPASPTSVRTSLVLQYSPSTETRAQRRISVDSTTTNRSSIISLRSDLDSSDRQPPPVAPSYTPELADFDTYYLDFDQGFAIGSDSEGEEDEFSGVESFPVPSSQLPHIRITSH